MQYTTRKLNLLLSIFFFGQNFTSVCSVHPSVVNQSSIDVQQSNTIVHISCGSPWNTRSEIWITNSENPDRETWLLSEENIFDKKQSVREYSLEMTKGYKLHVGSELVLYCSLKPKNFISLRSPISSSDLVIKNLDFSNLDLSNFTRKIDDWTIQFRISNATVSDSAVYICEIIITPKKEIPLCLSRVSVEDMTFRRYVLIPSRGNLNPTDSDIQQSNSILYIFCKSHLTTNNSIWITDSEDPDREKWLLFDENVFHKAQSIREYSVEMTADYDLLVGSELVLNCSLTSINYINLPSRISSSDLSIKRIDQDSTYTVRKIDDWTIQLRLPKAEANNSAVYVCEIKVTSNKKRPLCFSEVNVGYIPKITNYRCIIRNYDNMTCTWEIVNNPVKTNYEIETYFNNLKDFPIMCPKTTEKQTSCVWTRETVPPFVPFSGNMSFSIRGRNSLGNSTIKFSTTGFDMFIPNSPEKLISFETGSEFIFIKWAPPTMRELATFEVIWEFEIWLAKRVYDPSDIEVLGVTRNAFFFIWDLIPYVEYNISVRCRLFTEKNDNTWSPLASVVEKTFADVPFKTPEVIPEAYEIHLYNDFRDVSLYWKSVPKMFHNGENFHYHIKYFQIMPSGDLYISSENTSIPMIEIKNLIKNASYNFHIYSANHVGISEENKTIFVDKQENIPPGPIDVLSISQDLGVYNLSWNILKNLDNVSYTVFWCPSSKTFLSRCSNDSSVEWIPEDLSENSIVLNLTDIRTNIQFAVVAKTEARISGMHWASCFVPHRTALDKIRHVAVEPRNATTLQVMWTLDCSAVKALLEKYEIIYCRNSKNVECKVATVESNSESYLLHSLHPFSNYSIAIRTITKDGLASENSDAVLQTTLPAAPSGPPQNIKVYSRSNGSFHVNWMPPLEPNGIITKYIISYNDFTMNYSVESSQDEFNMEVVGLEQFTLYSVQIAACVENMCSVNSEPTTIRTDIGEPGYMDPPRIETVNSTYLKVSWTPPVQPNGPINFYFIEWHKDGQNTTSATNSKLKVSRSHFAFIDVKCSSSRDLGVNYHFYVRAANVKNDISLLGPLSDETQVTACIKNQGRYSGLQTSMETSLAIGLGVCGVLLILILLSCMRRSLKKKKRKKEFDFLNHNHFKRGCTDIFNPNLPLESQIDLLPYKNKWEFSKDRLKLGKTLGQGAFGRVVKAEAIGLVAGEASTTVAVKMLKQTAEKEERKALVAELKILVHIGKHLNIVNLLGAVTKNLEKGDLYIIMEYCCHGNLRHFLLEHKATFVDRLDHCTEQLITKISSVHSSSFSNDGQFHQAKNDAEAGSSVINVNDQDLKTSSTVSSEEYGINCCDDEYSKNSFITTCDLLCFSFQLARGMDYLSSRKLIHRDLAARNVLLAKDYVIKICDFGLAKDCDKYSNYIMKTKGLLPIKWMAIESIEDKVFTSKSDVWSFGILLWEIFTLGSSPYPGIEINEDFFKKLKNGYRMEKPKLAPDAIYQLMEMCWLDDPNQRPDFNSMAESIGALLEAGVRDYYMELNVPYQVMNENFFNNSDYLQMSKQNTEGYTNMDSSGSNQINDNPLNADENIPSVSTADPVIEMKNISVPWVESSSQRCIIIKRFI